MPLLSIEFAVFFIVFLPLYWAFARLPQVQNVLLLVAGLGWLYRIDPIFAALILVYSSVVYLVSVLMFSENENIRKFWLGCGISAALTVLCFFKYFDFFRPIIQQYGAKRRHRYPFALGLVLLHFPIAGLLSVLLPQA